MSYCTLSLGEEEGLQEVSQTNPVDINSFADQKKMSRGASGGEESPHRNTLTIISCPCRAYDTIFKDAQKNVQERNYLMGKHPSLIHFAMMRLDSLMAIGSSRHQAKIALREASEEKSWTVSTGKIFSHTTRKTYQQQVLAFINWVQEIYQIMRPACLDERADELVSVYLQKGIAEGKSPSTLQTQRSALRLFFGWQVASSVDLPKRTQETITRSRLLVEHDRHFQPANWPHQVLFARATGLRRAELRDLRIREVYTNESGQLVVYVRNGKGGKSREVSVLPEYEQDVRAVIEGREPEEHVFDHIPTAMDVQSYRRGSAQARYQQHAPQRSLPPGRGRLKPTDYDDSAAKKVSKALGHRRKSIVLTHYLR